MKVQTIEIIKPDDWHVHLREGDMMCQVLRYTGKRFGRALVMPNLKRAVVTSSDVTNYRDAISRAAETIEADFVPVMTAKMLQDTSYRDIQELAQVGTKAMKVYPEGVTTNSEEGVRDLLTVGTSVFSEMVEQDMVLCVHAEAPGSFSMDREKDYLDVVYKLCCQHPFLKVVIEHITTEVAVNFVKCASENVAATITPHHLFLTLDDVVGDKLAPHNFCKPVAKRPDDREALLIAATSGSPKFFLGTDSAPHKRGAKEASAGCAGCFCAPVAIELCAELFEDTGKLEALDGFTSMFGARFYGFEPSTESVLLDRKEWQVPDTIGEVVPFLAGKKMSWSIREGG